MAKIRVYQRETIDGKRKYVPGVKTANKKFQPGSNYYLRYSLNGKRVWKLIGDASEVPGALRDLQFELAGGQLATKLSPPEDAVRTPSTSLTIAIADYLTEVKAHRSHKTHLAYSKTLTLFMESCSKPTVAAIDRKDLMNFILFLKTQGSGKRTVRNRIDFLQIFLHKMGLPSVLTGSDLPKFTRKTVKAYNREQIAKMYAVADQDERDLILWLLGTGGREGDTMFVRWTDVDLVAGAYTITEHSDFTPKDLEEQTNQISDQLRDALIERRKRYPNTRLIFPGPHGKPNGHLLRIVKKLALRAGVNCGDRVNKAGLSCKDHPVCENVFLHKFRKTFASQHHKDGVSARQIMKLLRHSDLETTLRYLADDDDENLKATMNKVAGSNLATKLSPPVAVEPPVTPEPVVIPPPLPDCIAPLRTEIKQSLIQAGVLTKQGKKRRTIDMDLVSKRPLEQRLAYVEAELDRIIALPDAAAGSEEKRTHSLA